MENKSIIKVIFQTTNQILIHFQVQLDRPWRNNRYVTTSRCGDNVMTSTRHAKTAAMITIQRQPAWRRLNGKGFPLKSKKKRGLKDSTPQKLIEFGEKNAKIMLTVKILFGGYYLGSVKFDNFRL